MGAPLMVMSLLLIVLMILDDIVSFSTGGLSFSPQKKCIYGLSDYICGRFNFCFFDDDDDDGIVGSRISERALKNGLGVEMGERGALVERGGSVTCDGLLLGCWGGII